jgi:hypothetical protein
VVALGSPEALPPSGSSSMASFGDLATMPQPIPRGRKINASFRPGDVMQRPHLTPYIAAILMHWTEIEAHIGIFLAALLGAEEAETVVKVFLALQTDGGRKSTIDTVTKIKLLPDDLERFQEIQRDIGSRYSERNKVAHGGWGACPEYPNDLLWYDPRESVAMFPSVIAAADKRGQAMARTDELMKVVRVYTEADFKDIIERFSCTYSALEKFTKPYVGDIFREMQG